MTLPFIVFEGNLVADPELRFTPGGKAVANFRIACSEYKKQGDEWVEGDSTFLTVSCWEKLAENVAESVAKGSKVTVTGKLVQRSYETNNGEKRTVYEVRADTVSVSLRNTVAQPQRVQRSQTDARDPWNGGSDDTPPF